MITKKIMLLVILVAFLLTPSESILAKGSSKGNSGSSRKQQPKTYCNTCKRDKKGRIERDSSERRKFLESKGLTHTPPGDQVDHIIPLSKGGKDKVSNMQLIPKDSLKEKNELK